MATKVFYHSNCADGFSAAYAVWLKLGEDAQYIPAGYSSKSQEQVEEGDIVIAVDYSWPLPILQDVVAKAESVLVLDHHETAVRECEGAEIVFDNNKSGAVLAWEHYHEGPVPKLFQYVQDRDLWNWDLPKSMEISNVVHITPFTFEAWADLHRKLEMPGRFLSFVERGEAIQLAKDAVIERMCKTAHFEMIGKHKVPCVNTQAHISETGNRLCELFPDAPFSAVYFDLADGRRKFSLRANKDGVHLGELAKEYGGGGHARAAGFHSKGVKQILSEAAATMAVTQQHLDGVTRAILEANKHATPGKQPYTGADIVSIPSALWQNFVKATVAVRKKMGWDASNIIT